MHSIFNKPAVDSDDFYAEQHFSASCSSYYTLPIELICSPLSTTQKACNYATCFGKGVWGSLAWILDTSADPSTTFLRRPVSRDLRYWCVHCLLVCGS